MPGGGGTVGAAMDGLPFVPPGGRPGTSCALPEQQGRKLYQSTPGHSDACGPAFRLSSRSDRDRYAGHRLQPGVHGFHPCRPAGLGALTAEPGDDSLIGHVAPPPASMLALVAATLPIKE